MNDAPLLSLALTVDYPGKPAVLRCVALEVQRGEIMGLVGTSGSGKSTLALAILGLLAFKHGKASGTVSFEGRDLMACSAEEMRRLRGREIGLVLQSPMSALNPALRLRTQLKEAWQAHAESNQAWLPAARAALEEVSLPSDDDFLHRFPAQPSAGQSQRVLIGMAILHRPKLLIADEPTSALDVITQAEILDLFASLNQRLHMAILYISHDLLSVARICHRVAILYQGEIVECAATDGVLNSPQHPYTRKLIDAFPIAGHHLK